MSEHPVQHYLHIYQGRLSMAERSVTPTPPHVLAGMRRLVAGLSAQAPDAKVRLETDNSRFRFLAAATGELIGEFSITSDA